MKNPGPFLDTFLGHSGKGGGYADPSGGKPGAWDQGGWQQKQVQQPWQPPPEQGPSPAELEAIRRKKMAASQQQGTDPGMLDRARDMMGAGAGAAAGGGLLGWLFGRNSVGRSVLTHGGSAALGALAYRAWQSWQAGRAAPAAAAPATAAPAGAMPPAFTPGAVPAAGGEPFELALIRAMVAAAKADGHIDAAERGRIFEAVERSPLDAEQKGFVFSLLNQDITVEQIAGAAAGQEQAAQLWLAARMALELDHAAERAFLDALTARLALPAELVAQLERQVQGAIATEPRTT